MTAIIHLIRQSPIKLLKEYFSHSYFKEIDWALSNQEILRPILQALDKMIHHEREILILNAERVEIMTDELGQAALISVANDCNALRKMGTAHHRALWTFLYEIKNFKQAEEIRYAAVRFPCEMYDGFIGPKNIDITLDAEIISIFEQQIKNFFKLNGNSKVEIFKRSYTDELGKKIKLFQVMIYLEELPRASLELIEQDLAVKIICPAEELAITYRPETGQIDITFKNDIHRKDLVKIFVQTLLFSPDMNDITPERYNIAKLLKPYKFVTDPKDGIESVKIMFMELRPLGNNNRLIIKRSAQELKSIHEILQKLFGEIASLETKFELVQVTLFICFFPDENHKRGKQLSVTISLPNKCNVKSKNIKERFIINKYIKRWGLIESVL